MASTVPTETTPSPAEGSAELFWLDWLKGQLVQGGTWLCRAKERDLDFLEGASEG